MASENSTAATGQALRLVEVVAPREQRRADHVDGRPVALVDVFDRVEHALGLVDPLLLEEHAGNLDPPHVRPSVAHPLAPLEVLSRERIGRDEQLRQ